MAPASWGKKYSYAQLEQLWINAGGPKAVAPLMAAIAIAESGGYEKRLSPPNKDGTIDRGLWQINSVHGKLSTTEATSNASAAVKIYKTQGLRAWSTYNNNAYKQYMKGGVAPDPNLPSGSTSNTNGTAQQAGLAGDLGGAIGKGFADAFSAILQPIISFAIWGTEIMLGGALILIGLLIFLANTERGKETTKKVGSFALNAATLAVAPEAEPEVAAATAAERGAAKAAASRTAARKAATGPRAVKSKAEFQQVRQSGYKGPVRHDY